MTNEGREQIAKRVYNNFNEEEFEES